jgi:DNA invertase Pin-like site-specific DNA recombinase
MESEYTKAIIYCRVSSEKQVKEGNGLDSQEHRCREYAVSLGLEVESVFRDEGISGGLFDRPAVKALLKYLDAHWQNKYVVIFDDLKRFARDVEVHIKLKTELRAREAKLRCPNYNFDDSAEGEFVETIFAAQNELERKQNRRQVCQKMKARVERGYWCFYPPTGYEYRKDKDHGKLIFPIHPIADIIGEGLTAFAEDRLVDQSDLIKFLRSKNVHNILGKKEIYFEFVKRLLTEPLYAGIIEYPEWGVSQRRGHHRAIISEATYNGIQAKLRRNARKVWKADNCDFPLRRLVSCIYCGKKMTASVCRGKNPNKGYPHYTCNNRECQANPKNITASVVESDFLKMLETIAVDQKLLVLAKEIATRKWEEKLQGAESERAYVEAEIKSIENQIDEFMNLIPTAHSDTIKARYESKIEGLDQRIKDLQVSLQNKKYPEFTEALNLLIKFLGTPAEAWQNAGRELKSMVHGLIFTENPKYSLQTGFGTPSLTLPFLIKQEYCDENCKMVEVARFTLASKKSF